jgi:hypothetical protein
MDDRFHSTFHSVSDSTCEHFFFIRGFVALAGRPTLNARLWTGDKNNRCFEFVDARQGSQLEFGRGTSSSLHLIDFSLRTLFFIRS